MSDGKYIVFKAEDWHGISAMFDRAVGFGPGKLPMPLTDAVVIRTQDVFAGPGLSAYAAAIQTGIDLNPLHSPEAFVLIKRLEVIRDYFHERAQEAFDHPAKKIPD